MDAAGYKEIIGGNELRRERVVLAGKVFLTVLAFSMNYAIVEQNAAEENFEKIFSIIPNISAFLHSIDAQPFKVLMLILIMIPLFRKSAGSQLTGRKRAAVELLTLAATVSLLVGKAAYQYEGLEIMFLGITQSAKSFVLIAGYYLFFRQLFHIMLNGYERYMEKRTYCAAAGFFHRKYAGMIIFLALLSVWGIVLFVYYPAIFMGDTEDILYMAFEKASLTNHHPVLYTVLVGSIMKFFSGGGNACSVFLCALVQCIVNAVILSYSSVYCARQLKQYRATMAAVLFWIICPWISKYAIMITKDTFFACFVLLFAVKLHKLLRCSAGNGNLISVLLSAILVVLFRKNGFYVVVLTFILLLFLDKTYWKRWFLCIIVIVACNIGYSDILLPAAGVADGSVREALSIPFQQTARYVQKHGDEVTGREREAIDAVLQYDVLAEVYSPDLSDPVKGTYRNDARKEDLAKYFKVWFDMFWKHPETYVAATLCNYYGYFYPVVNDVQKLYNTSVGSMYNAGRDGYFQIEHLYDEAHVWLRDICSLYDMVWMKLPILNTFMTSAFYVWAVLCGCLIKFVRDEKAGFVFMVVYGLVALTAMAGPCNAIDYERYIYALILGFPILLGVLFCEEQGNIVLKETKTVLD